MKLPPLLHPIQRKFQALMPRDQKAVTILAVFLAALFLWLGVWQPIEKSRTASLAAYQVASADLAWMQAHAAQIQPSQAKVHAETPNLLTTVSDTATLYQLAISHAEPSDDGSLRISLENVAFDRLLAWLDSLQREHSVKPTLATIEGQPSSLGMVTTILVLRPEN